MRYCLHKLYIQKKKSDFHLEASLAGFTDAEAASYAQEQIDQLDGHHRRNKLSDKEIEESFWRDLDSPRSPDGGERGLNS